MVDLEALRRLVFASDNAACFLERDTLLSELEQELREVTGPDRYARILSALLDRVSTPVEAPDVFVGRIPEGPVREGIPSPNTLLAATGHMSFDYRRLLTRGLRGIAEEAEAAAVRLGDGESASFAHNARLVAEAVRRYAARYAQAARRAGKARAAEALSRVPYEPAYDLFSALQGIWIVHMIASGYVGARDYAFGRMDDYLYPYYRQALEEGATQEELLELLACFYVKPNEICGRATHNYRCKPVLCQAAKQYLVVGGAHPNPLSCVLLRAAEISRLAEPVITVLLRPQADEAFTRQVFETQAAVTDAMQVYNYDRVLGCLLDKGIPREVAEDFTYSACDTFDLHYRTIRHELYLPTVELLCGTLGLKEGAPPPAFRCVDDILRELAGRTRAWLEREAPAATADWPLEDNRRAFVLDSLLIGECTRRCRYPLNGGMAYKVLNAFIPGIATIGDSLMAVDRLVFQQRRFTLAEFCRIVAADFAGHEDLRQEILAMARFGNDTPADEYTARAAKALLDAVDAAVMPPGVLALGGFYSLDRDNTLSRDLPATPDGRRAGAPYSENQSPTYGADRSGATALLRSLARLPFGRTAGGGLNLSFSSRPAAETLRALILSYFEMGGQHVGISVLDRAELEDAVAHPDRHPALTVRLYGFSEYFVSLPPWQQQAILNRTRLHP